MARHSTVDAKHGVNTALPAGDCILFYFALPRDHLLIHRPSPVRRSLFLTLYLSPPSRSVDCRTRTVIFFVLLAMSESVLLLRLHVVSRRTEPSDELHAVAERFWTADEYHGMVVRKPQTRFNGLLPPRPPTGDHGQPSECAGMSILSLLLFFG